MIRRTEVSEVMTGEFDGDTAAERNQQRYAAVVEFLKDKPNRVGLQGSEHDMILSDLKSYSQWEKEDGGEQPEGRNVRRQAVQHPHPSRSRPH